MSSSAAIASSAPATAPPAANNGTTPVTTTNSQQASQYRGIVKQVISGDCVVIRSVTTKDGKNLEKQIMLSNITAPRLGRRTNPQGADSVIDPDQV